MGFSVITKLRKDANLSTYYLGEKTGKPGTPKIYDHKVNWNNLTDWFPEEHEKYYVYSNIVYAKGFKRKMTVVVVDFKKGGGSVIIASTNCELSTKQILKYYISRFQIEFIFRDAKQHTGLQDAQTRKAKGIIFHCNVSLSTTNILRLEERKLPKNVISLASRKRYHYNHFLLSRFIDIFGLYAELSSNQSKIQKVLNIGRIAS